mgnify:CR=1 FL=1
MFTREMEIQAQIDELKFKLSQTDYQAIKYAEGELMEYEYEPIKKQRKQWRAQINALQQQLKMI